MTDGNLSLKCKLRRILPNQPCRLGKKKSQVKLQCKIEPHWRFKSIHCHIFLIFGFVTGHALGSIQTSAAFKLPCPEFWLKQEKTEFTHSESQGRIMFPYFIRNINILFQTHYFWNPAYQTQIKKTLSLKSWNINIYISSCKMLFSAFQLLLFINSLKRLTMNIINFQCYYPCKAK